MTWNLWWKFGPWLERQPAIVSELARVDPDVVCLQEVWADDDGDQAEKLADELGYHHVRSRNPDGSPQPFGNAILSRRPLTLLTQLDLPDPRPEQATRTALFAVFADEPHGRLLVTTHLAWQYHVSAVRQDQLQAVVDTVATILADDEPEPPRPVILTGDLNGSPDTQEIRRLTGLEPGYHPNFIFIDSWAAVGDGAGYTWTRDNPHAVEASWPRRRLDYVLVSWPRLKPFCSPLSARLAGTEPYTGSSGVEPVVPSDHYAVVVELDDRLGVVV